VNRHAIQVALNVWEPALRRGPACETTENPPQSIGATPHRSSTNPGSGKTNHTAEAASNKIPSELFHGAGRRGVWARERPADRRESLRVTSTDARALERSAGLSARRQNPLGPRTSARTRASPRAGNLGFFRAGNPSGRDPENKRSVRPGRPARLDCYAVSRWPARSKDPPW